MKLIILLSNLLAINVIASNSCNFHSESYCGSDPGIINIRIDHLIENSYNITAEVFGQHLNCNNETLTCVENGKVNYPKDSTDCLNHKLNSYGIDADINYNNSSDYIDIKASFADIQMKSC